LHKFYEKVRIALEEKKIESTRHLRTGSCSTFDQYRFVCGKLQAYEDATDILRDWLDYFQNGKNYEPSKPISPQELKQRQAQEKEDNGEL
jgi:hypothetical protein